MPQKLKFDRAKARQMRAKGMTFSEIADRLGVSTPGIYYGLTRELSAHHEFLRSLTPEQLEDYREYIRAGIPVAEVKQIFGEKT